MAVISRPHDDPQPLAPTVSPEGGKPDAIPVGQLPSEPVNQQQTDYGEDVDLSYWIQCMDDAERAEGDFRKRGREVVEIYRNDSAAGKGRAKVAGKTTFNILYANTEVLLGAVYQKPPQPVVRSRFASAKSVPMLPQAPMMGPAGPGGPPDAPVGPAMGGPIPPPMTPAGAPPPPMSLAGALPPPMPPDAGMMGPPPDFAGEMAEPLGLEAGMPPMGSPAPDTMAGPMGVPPELGPPEGGPPAPVGMPGGLMGLQPPAAPEQKDIETAAAIVEKALEIVVDDEHSHEAVKTAIKDVLLPGRGICRVRWKPEMKTQPVTDPVMGGQLNLPGQPGTPQTIERKVWEEVDDEYVFWEDFLCDPVRQAKDCDWIGFRHLFSQQALKDEFAGNPKFDAIVAAGKINDLLVWTDETAAKHMVGGGSAPKTASKLGNHRRKAMVWEVWDRITRSIIWLIRDGAGLVLRVDPDSMQLAGFYPVPVPMLAVTTSDSRIPKTYYDLYAKLASDLDTISDRISRLQDKLKIRGAYNSSSKEIADILTADDGKMLPVAGVDMLNGGLQNHIWLLPIADWIAALQQMYVAQDEIKNAIYEVMGISDIMRGATKATETATAQRIKGSMGVSRLEDMKGIAGNFVRDMLRLKAEVICKNFDPETLAKMTGEEVTPPVMAILRSEFQRTCAIDIESDSTVVPDEQAEQESMAMVVQAIGVIMGGAQQMMQTAILPPPYIIQLAMELMKMALHPIRYSRPVVELLNSYQEQIEQIIAVGANLGPPPMPGQPPGMGHNGGPPMQGGSTSAPRPSPGGGGPRPNGAGKPPLPGMPPAPEMAA